MTVPHRNFPPRGDKPMQAPVDEEELVATYERDADVPFYVEPFLGYRAWSLVDREDGFWLRSVTYSTFWPKRQEMHATCRMQSKANRCVSSPNPSCSCGIYIVKDLGDAKTWATSGTSHFRVIGEVKIWGRVLQYEKGFIVEYAYPDKIWVTDDYSFWEEATARPDATPEEIARALEDSYGVEVSVGWPDSE